MTNTTLAAVRDMDRSDPLREYRRRFVLPEDVAYLDGNSLGAPPLGTRERLLTVFDEQWGSGLVRSWNTHDWISSPVAIGAKIATLIGADQDEVIVTDSTSVNIFRLVSSALEMQSGRRTVLSEVGNFPTDLYCCEGAIRAAGNKQRLRLVARERIAAAIDGDTALVVLTHVHYKSGEFFDMAEIDRIAHERGALVLWDLSHSAGALHVALNEAQADFAVGCGYKYLNGGPGAPAYLYVAKRHHERAVNHVAGWMGHDRPFDFTDEFRPATGIRRFLAGTPSILANSALDVGVDMILEVGIPALMEKSKRLSTLFVRLIDEQCNDPALVLASPRDPEQRGSHVSYAHHHGYEVMQALIAAKVIGDFRTPDVIRFGFTPLYTRFEDIWIAVQRLTEILAEQRWKEPRFAVRSRVT